MTQHHKIFKLDDGSALKVTASLLHPDVNPYGHQYHIHVERRAKGERAWSLASDIPAFKLRKIKMKEQKQALYQEFRRIAGDSRIRDVLHELWQQIQPDLDSNVG